MGGNAASYIALGGQYKAYNGLFYGGIGPFVGLGFDATLDDLDIDLYKKNLRIKLL